MRSALATAPGERLEKMVVVGWEVVVMVDWEVMMLVMCVGGRALEGKDL